MKNIQDQLPQHLKFLQGGGEMGELTRTYKWVDSIVGDPSGWPFSLQTMVGVILRAKMPMFLWWGEELIQFYNDAYRPSLGIRGKHPKALGQPGAKCWPEIWPVIKPLIDQVLFNEEATWQEDALIPIYRNNTLEDVYWTFSYSYVPDDMNGIGGVLVICNETTQKVNLVKALTKSGEELLTTKKLAEKQRDRLKRFLMEAPAGICILKGPEMVYELINPNYQCLFPGRALLGKPLLEAVPELIDQPIMQVLKKVYRDKQTFEGQALLIPLPNAESSNMEDHYFNFIYQPEFDIHGETNGIMVFLFDVTEMIKTEKDLERTKHTLDSAIQAAELGIFNYDLFSKFFELNNEGRIIFEIPLNHNIDFYQDFIKRINPDDLSRIISEAKKSVIPGELDGNYDVEFRLTAINNEQVRWVKARGRAYFDIQKQPLRFSGAFLDITEQKVNEIRKNDFIGIVSHELKTPLTSLTAYLQLISRKGGMNIESIIPKIDVQLKKMSGLINGFLNVSRFEAGKIDLYKSSFNVRELLEEIIEEQSLATRHFITLDCSIDLLTYADREKIASVVSNLLSNAVKYSPNGGNILIKHTIDDKGHLFCVQDEGMGIKSADLPKLFERFFRVATIQSQNISGFGIGLYLSAEIVRLHGGKIWAESNNREGSKFFFEIPF
jgi:two-component system sensor histidine kinase VicK